MSNGKIWKKWSSGFIAFLLAAVMVFSSAVYAAEGTDTETIPQETEISVEAEAEAAPAEDEAAADPETAETEIADTEEASEIVAEEPAVPAEEESADVPTDETSVVSTEEETVEEAADITEEPAEDTEEESAVEEPEEAAAEDAAEEEPAEAADEEAVVEEAAEDEAAPEEAAAEETADVEEEVTVEEPAADEAAAEEPAAPEKPAAAVEDSFTAKSANSYTIKFNPNGGTWSDTYYKEEYQTTGITWEDDDTWLNTPGSYALTKSGYSLAGWSLTANGAAIETYNFSTTKNLTLYAVWKKSYTVKFNPNGGTWSETYYKEEYETTGSTWYEGGYLSRPYSDEITRTGYALAGWSLTANGDTIDLYDFTTTKNVTLYAVWKKSYTVKFNPNGGTWSETYYKEEYETTGSTWYEGGYLSRPYSSEITRTGYALAGWSLTSKGDAIDLYDFTTTKNVTLYAVWKKSYTIKFNPNGGTWTTGGYTDYKQKYETTGTTWYEGGYLNTPYSDELTRKGYVLSGWSLTKNGVAIERYGFSTTKNVTLYAIWKKEFKVTLNTNGGTWSADYSSWKEPRTFADGDTAWLPGGDTTITKKGYKLVGWSEKKSGGTVVDTYTVTKNVTLYAQWKAAYTVTFNANGGEISDYSKKALVVKGESFSLPLYNVSRSGYELAGWTVKKNKGTVLRGEYTPSKNITLYAKWAKNIKLTLNAGKGTFSDGKSKATVTVGTGLAIGNRLPEPTLKNQVFLGWYTDKKCTKPVKRASTFKKAKTLYAKWQAKPLKITVYNLKGSSYDKRGTDEYVSNSTANSYAFYIDKGSAIGSISAWKDGSRAQFYFDKAFTKPYYSSYVPKSNMKVYAKWNDEVTVKWDANGGYRMYYAQSGEGAVSGSVTSYKSLMCDELPTGEDMVKKGYYFAGWYLSTDSKKKVLPISHVFNKDTTVKAKWVKGIKITLKLAGGTLDYRESRYVPNFYTKKKATIGSIVGYVPNPYKEGYVFAGWKSSVTKKTVMNLESEKPTKATTYTAVWKKPAKASKTVTVTLKGGYGSLWNDETQLYVTSMKIKVPKNSTVATANLYEYAISHDERGKHLEFKGWSAVKENGKLLDENYTFTKKVTLYPVWKSYDLRVALVTNGGSYLGWAQNSPIVFFTAKKGKITLPTKSQMEREGYKFAGWYSDAKFKKKLSNQKTYTVKKGGVYLYAKWTKK